MKKAIVSNQGSRYDVTDIYDELGKLIGDKQVTDTISKSLEAGEHMIYPNLKKLAKSKGFEIKWIARDDENKIVFDVYPTHGNFKYTVIGFIISDEDIDADFTESVIKELEELTPEQQSKAFWRLVDLGIRIKRAREEASMTQSELAEAVNSSQSNVYRWETGKADPVAETLMKIAKATGCTINYLMGDFPHLPDTWTPALVIPTKSDTPHTAKEASRLLYDDTGDPYYQGEFLDDYDELTQEGWITWENGALVQWMDGIPSTREIERYKMYVK